MSASRIVSIVLAGMIAALGIALAVSLPAGPTVPEPVLFGGPSEERDSIVAFEARRAGMDPALAIAVSHVENWAGDSAAVHVRSGAVGLMQVMPFWADSFHVECYGPGSLTGRRRNACIGARIAVRYFVDCGNWNCALVWYVGARCTKRDTPLRCIRKEQVGEAYVLGVVERFDRTDLSPARDAMAHGAWRAAQADYKGSSRPDRLSVLETHSFGATRPGGGRSDPGASLAVLP